MAKKKRAQAAPGPAPLLSRTDDPNAKAAPEAPGAHAAPSRAWLARGALFALVHVGVALAFVLRRDGGGDAAWRGFPLDDSWIHHVYARSVAGGGLFEYVTGRPEAGFTSPLWVLCLAPFWWLSSDPHRVSLFTKVLGVLLAIATSVVADRLARRVGGSPRAGLLAGLAVAVDPNLAFSAVSGMEVPLAGLLLVSSVLAWVERRPGVTGVALGLALAARPELALVTVVIAGASALVEAAALRRFDPAALRHFTLLLLPSVAIGGAWSAFCFSVAGRPLPNTFYAKHDPANLLEVVEDLPRIFVLQPLDSTWFFLGSGGVLVGLAIVRVLRDSKLERPRAIALLALPLVFLVGIAWAHEIIFVRAFATLRYELPQLPLALVLLAVGADEGLARLADARRLRTLRALVLASLTVLGLALPLVALPMRFARQASAYAWNCQNIEEMQVLAGEWLRAHTEPGDVIATHDAGAMRLFSDRPVLDLAGLNEHRTTSLGYSLLDLEPPRYLVIFPSWFPHLASSPRLRTVYRVSASRYTICPCSSTFLLVLEPLVPGAPLRMGGRGGDGADTVSH